MTKGEPVSFGVVGWEFSGIGWRGWSWVSENGVEDPNSTVDWAGPEGEGSCREDAAHTEDATPVRVIQLNLTEFISSYGLCELVVTGKSRISEGVVTIDEFGQRAIFANKMSKEFNAFVIH